MNNKLNKVVIERFSRQLILKDIGIVGQKKILSAKVLVIGAGGLGSPAAEFLARAGVGLLGVIDNDKVNLSNLNRQTLYDTNDIGKFKVSVVKKKIKKINPNTKTKIYKVRLNKSNFKKIINDYEYIIDGSDNFATKFLINDFCFKFKKVLVAGAISKFDGHIFTFNFKDKKIPCLRCFFQESEITDNLQNCESEGILGTVAGIIGAIQANEVLKKIPGIGKGLDGYIFILDLLRLNFRKVKINKKDNCLCR